MTILHTLAKAFARKGGLAGGGRKLSRQATRIAALRRLKATGFVPRTVYDIGAYKGEWTAESASVFPEADFVLFEANRDNEPDLARDGRSYFLTVLSASDGEEREFFTPKGTKATSASLYRENSIHHAEEEINRHRIITARLDTIVLREGLPAPDLIKIDVQGAELDVMEGARAALTQCGVLILEASLLPYNNGAPLFDEVVSFARALGFRAVDVCERHHIKPGLMVQIDLLLANEDVFAKYCDTAGLPAFPLVTRPLPSS